MEITRQHQKEKKKKKKQENQSDVTTRLFACSPFLSPLPSPFLSPSISIKPLKTSKNCLTPFSSACKLRSLFPRIKRRSSRTSYVTGTVFGLKIPDGHLHFAIQLDPKSPPLLVIELATCTKSFLSDLAEGPVQFMLTCMKDCTGMTGTSISIYEEWKWTERNNGRIAGSVWRCIEQTVNLEFLNLVEHVTCGAGVVQDYEDKGMKGDLMFMRANFERVKRSFDWEDLTMVGSVEKGCPEISFSFSRA
ncbi:hypothetical protein LUZ60_011124 [Juncus effusus]|nr:hypothetical protein LUZ60_011124 [Juncus effusus]